LASGGNDSSLLSWDYDYKLLPSLGLGCQSSSYLINLEMKEEIPEGKAKMLDVVKS
jgi:hypothetical protein